MLAARRRRVGDRSFMVVLGVVLCPGWIGLNWFGFVFGRSGVEVVLLIKEIGAEEINGAVLIPCCTAAVV